MNSWYSKNIIHTDVSIPEPIHSVPPRGLWMDYMCMCGSLGNSSTASESSDPDGTLGQS